MAWLKPCPFENKTSAALSHERRLHLCSRRSADGRYYPSMAVIYISEAEAARDFAGLMDQVRAGAEVVIENGSFPAAVLRAVAPPRRSISESIALAEARSRELGYKPVMDAAYAADMEEVIRSRKPRDPSAWD